MSYILDALKKSDSERKQGDVPNLQTIHIPIDNEPQAPLALYGLIAFLLLWLAFLIGWLVADKEPSGIELAHIEHTETKQVVKSESKLEVQPADIAIKSQSVNRVVEPIQPKHIESKSIKPKSSIKKSAVVEVVKSAPKVIDVPSKKLMPPKTQNTDIADISAIPYLHEMPDYQQQSVPQMTFAGHVYSSNKASRSVIINDVFMSEGDELLPEINVVEITASGVVFSLSGSYFRIDILQDWSFD